MATKVVVLCGWWALCCVVQRNGAALLRRVAAAVVYAAAAAAQGEGERVLPWGHAQPRCISLQAAHGGQRGHGHQQSVEQVHQGQPEGPGHCSDVWGA